MSQFVRLVNDVVDFFIQKVEDIRNGIDQILQHPHICRAMETCTVSLETSQKNSNVISDATTHN